MEPEISHRCKSCGASIRVGALFCPQCGGPLGESAESVASTPDTEKIDEDKISTRDLSTTSPTVKSELKELPSSGKQSGGHQTSVMQKGAASVAVARVPETSDLSHKKRGRFREMARDKVADNLKPRMDKLRRASSVVLEEASAIDPSFRFVLVALLLFIVFIVLLLLSFMK